MAGKLNGNTVPVIVITLLIALFGLFYHVDGKTNDAIRCAGEARETAVRVEEREAAHFDEVMRSLDEIKVMLKER